MKKVPNALQKREYVLLIALIYLNEVIRKLVFFATPFQNALNTSTLSSYLLKIFDDFDLIAKLEKVSVVQI